MSSKDSSRIHAQLAAIMAEVEAVGKDRKNQTQGYNFRGIEDVMDALHPIFAKHKVYILSEVIDERTEERTTQKGGSLIYRVLKVKVALVSGEDGSREIVTVVGEGMDSGDKASNKAMSAALKYALTQSLLLPYAVVEGDATSPEPSTKKPAAPSTAAAQPEPAADGRMKSAYDGRALKPGEDPRPAAAPATGAPLPAAAATDATAFNARLYTMMEMTGVTEDALTAYLRVRGLMTANQTIHNLGEKFVTTMTDGVDKKSGRKNWDLIVEGVKKGRAA